MKKKLTGWPYEGAAMREAIFGEPKKNFLARKFRGRFFGKDLLNCWRVGERCKKPKKNAQFRNMSNLTKNGVFLLTVKKMPKTTKKAHLRGSNNT